MTRIFPTLIGWQYPDLSTVLLLNTHTVVESAKILELLMLEGDLGR